MRAARLFPKTLTVHLDNLSLLEKKPLIIVLFVMNDNKNIPMDYAYIFVCWMDKVPLFYITQWYIEEKSIIQVECIPIKLPAHYVFFVSSRDVAIDMYLASPIRSVPT